MKKYKIIVKDKKTGTTIEYLEIHSLFTKGRLIKDLKLKYKFHNNPVSINIERMVRSNGKRLNIFDFSA